ncbi:hypothetical protein EII20_02560 [Comamonadaceae bacterium OH2545_COT-014]|nr:hypothetical protein EII20_02560 [Comamonadaceae bacterium OH2545_COT-014]
MNEARLLRGRSLARALLWPAVALGLAACQPAGSAREVLRLPSPDAALEAVLVERNFGATVPYVHELFVLPHGARVDGAGKPAVRLVGATRNEQAWGADLQWPSPETLQVRYAAARQVRDHRASVTVGGRVVSVLLQPGVVTPGRLPVPKAPASATDHADAAQTPRL